MSKETSSEAAGAGGIPRAKNPAAIWVLGFVSMLADIGSEMIHSLLPVFLVTVVGASALTVGLIEGVAEATALIVKVFSGTLSDYLGRRKALAVIGYGLGGLSKPLFAIAGSTGLVVLTARFLDRIGKGIRGAPRDALVADITPPSVRGAAYGLRQALDTVGAFVGPLLAIALMLLWANDFRAVFWVAVIPALAAALLLLVGVEEPDRPVTARRVNPIQREEIKRLAAAYWWVVGLALCDRGPIRKLARCRRRPPQHIGRAVFRDGSTHAQQGCGSGRARLSVRAFRGAIRWLADDAHPRRSMALSG